MFKLAIFDMDGLLIDSEPFWQEAQLEIFKTVGVPITLEMTLSTMGLRVDEVVNHWHKKYPWDSPSPAQITDQIDEKVVELAKTKGKALSGVTEIIDLIDSHNIPMAIASSSSQILIDTVTEKLNIKDRIKFTYSGREESHGKPHPAVFLTTLQRFNETYGEDIHPNECIVFEDSVNGLIAAKAAKMKCIAVPHPELIEDKRFNIADRTLGSLSEVNLQILKDIANE